MDLSKYIVDRHIAELRSEADATRILRIVDEPRPEPTGWPTRARRRLGDTLVAAGETLRGSIANHELDRAA